MEVILPTCGCPHYKDDTIKMIIKYFENRFLRALVVPIREHQNSRKALNLLVSDQRLARKYLFRCYMAFFKCKNT